MSMESILRSFSIGFLLRNLFAGVFFVLGYRVAARGLAPPSGTDVDGLFSIVASTALVAGVTAYGLHRSLIYPLIEAGMNSVAAEHLRRRLPLISSPTARRLLQQWDRGAEGDKVGLERAKHITSWGDYSQLEYTSALCILLGAAIRVVSVKEHYVLSWPVVCLAVVLAIAGLVADWRLRAIQEYMRGDET